MKRIIWYVVFMLVLAALYVVFYHPDMLVEGSVVELHPTALVKPTIPATTVQAQIPQESVESPVTAPKSAAVSSVPSQQPTAKSVPSTNNTVTNYNPSSVLNGGYSNYCYQMADGSWTTVIFSGTPGANMYPYAGALDPTTNAPATAAGSQAWCAANAPTN